MQIYIIIITFFVSVGLWMLQKYQRCEQYIEMTNYKKKKGHEGRVCHVILILFLLGQR